MGTGWNVTAYTCCIETVAALWLRAMPEKRQRRKPVRLKWTWTAGGPRDGEQKLTKTKGSTEGEDPSLLLKLLYPGICLSAQSTGSMLLAHWQQ